MASMVRPPGLGPGGDREAWRPCFPVRSERFHCRSRAGSSGMDVRPRRVCGASDALGRPLRQDGRIVGLGGPFGGGAESASVAIIEPPAFRRIEGFSLRVPGETLMPERKAALRRPSAQKEAVRDHLYLLTSQLELFAGEALGSTIGAPTWPALPRETRLALTGLDGAAAHRPRLPKRGPLRDGGR